MTKACFKSKSFGRHKMRGSLREHNERDFDLPPQGMSIPQATKLAKTNFDAGLIKKMPHYKPWYILDDAYALGNDFFHRKSIQDVTEEYLATTKWGRKYGKLHHQAKPFREAIITFNSEHTIKDFEVLADKLEAELDIQVMYCYMHRDEGSMDEQGKAKYNFHAHLGFTNLKNGKLNHFDNVKCKKAQDICAAILKMERGAVGSDAIALDHKEFRVTAKREAQLKKEAHIASETGYDHWRQSEKLELANENLSDQVGSLSKQVRELLKDNSELAAELNEEKTKAKAYQDAKKAKDAQDIIELQRQLNEALKQNNYLKQLANGYKKQTKGRESEINLASKTANELANNNISIDDIIKIKQSDHELVALTNFVANKVPDTELTPNNDNYGLLELTEQGHKRVTTLGGKLQHFFKFTVNWLKDAVNEAVKPRTSEYKKILNTESIQTKNKPKRR